MLFPEMRPWLSCNSYTLVWPVSIPCKRSVETVEVCVYIPDFENGENRFRLNRTYRGKSYYVLTPKQRHNIEVWLSAYRDRSRVHKQIIDMRQMLEALMKEEARLCRILSD